MARKLYTINKNASIIYRLSQIYFDAELSPYRIGCGQQFFLLRIYDFPGISILDLARKGYFDKGTTARAVKKLEELGYVRREIDENDRRISRLYITEAACPVIETTISMLRDWNSILTDGFSAEEKAAAERMMDRMADNAFRAVKDRKREREWTE